MKASHAGVTIVGGLGVVGLNDFVELLDERPQLLGVHRCVLDVGQGFRVSSSAHQQTQAGASQRPYLGLFRGFEDVQAGVSQALPGHVGAEVGES